jgi:hypothetical protein
MSQRKSLFPMIDKEAGLRGFVLRPLSAKFLDITIPEKKGIVKREKLFGISGRSRKPQIALAEEFGLKDYPAPAGGCLLTEPNYAYRLMELLEHNKNPEFRDINILRIGRHFRFSSDCKIIVGRNRSENEILLSLTERDAHILKVEGYGSPITAIGGTVTDSALFIAASLCARYSDAKHLPEVKVTVSNNGKRFCLKVPPATEEIISKYRIEKKPASTVIA